MQRATKRAWLIWFAAALVYLIAVFHRASFGVAGLDAMHRFGLGAAALSTFTVLQLGVYAAMQIPTGLLVDRFGPRRVLAVAAVAMGAGQVLLAEAGSYPVALLARGVLGLGDALTFVAVLRLVAEHFPARQYPLVATLTTALGYVGNLAATVPLAALLGAAGWQTTFLTAGLVTIGYAALALCVVRNTPRGTAFAGSPPVRPRVVATNLRAVWRRPGTRLGFWLHFTTMFVPNTMTLLWGVPFLVTAQGLDAGTASGLLTVFVFGSMVGGPVVGTLISRRPSVRLPLAVGYVIAAVLCAAVLLGTPGPLPVPVLAVVFAVLSFGGPASTIGFALARDYNPRAQVGAATGMVNVGGFSATTLTTLAIGVLLQVFGGLAGETAYRISMLVIPTVLVFGAWRTLTWWRRTRAAVLAAQRRGDTVPFTIRHRRFDQPVPAGTH